jgi:hypothetical protein
MHGTFPVMLPSWDWNIELRFHPTQFDSTNTVSGSALIFRECEKEIGVKAGIIRTNTFPFSSWVFATKVIIAHGFEMTIVSILV